MIYRIDIPEYHGMIMVIFHKYAILYDNKHIICTLMGCRLA